MKHALATARGRRAPSFRGRLALAWLLVSALLPTATAKAQQVYWLDTRYAAPTLNRANPDGTSPQSLVLPAGSLPEGLTIDPVHHRLYWTEATYTGARVRSCGLDFSFPGDMVTGGSALRGIAVDGSGGQLFWTASNTVTGPMLWRSGLDGSATTTIVSPPLLANPRGIAYTTAMAPPALFVCDAAADMIDRFDVNGSGGSLVGLLPGSRPYGIAVDAVNSRVYFTEYGSGRIESRDLSGASPALLLSGLANPTYIAVDPHGGNMYWVEGGAGSQRVMRATLAGGSPANLGLPLTTYGGIAFAPASLILGVDEPPIVHLALGAIRPNPARAEARIEFELPAAQRVHLSVFDLQGREVAVLVDGELEAGRHTALVARTALRAGVYVVRMHAAGLNLTRRMVLVR